MSGFKFWVIFIWKSPFSQILTENHLQSPLLNAFSLKNACFSLQNIRFQRKVIRLKRVFWPLRSYTSGSKETSHFTSLRDFLADFDHISSFVYEKHDENDKFRLKYDQDRCLVPSFHLSLWRFRSYAKTSPSLFHLNTLSQWWSTNFSPDQSPIFIIFQKTLKITFQTTPKTAVSYLHHRDPQSSFQKKNLNIIKIAYHRFGPNHYSVWKFFKYNKKGDVVKIKQAITSTHNKRAHTHTRRVLWRCVCCHYTER